MGIPCSEETGSWLEEKGFAVDDCGINLQRKEVYPQDLKRVRVSVVRIRKREGKGR